MKKLSIAIQILFSLILIGQTKTIKIRNKKEKIDTLKLLQGKWDFECIMIPNNKKSKENYLNQLIEHCPYKYNEVYHPRQPWHPSDKWWP